uniref:FBD domain-containing protein n=1 Tax=Brassica oleracea TaxID=3712 RepID=A0A3P6CKS0_BRAOL|nr:unnamed protein product [Brassica oleracea]
MLDSSPKLQSLKLYGVSNYSGASFIIYFDDCPVGWEWTQPKCVPECLLLHLETLVWRRYGWQR